VPIAEWFRGPLQDRVRAALTGQRLQDTGLFDGTAIAGLIDDHVAGMNDHSGSLWALLMFESFLRQVHDVSRVPADTAAAAPAAIEA
jgi:asparagine synthase (glutamine-hydrolysing)